MLATSPGELPSLRNYVEPDSMLIDFCGPRHPRSLIDATKIIAPRSKLALAGAYPCLAVDATAGERSCTVV
jgi:hypothetical protein